MTTRLKKHLFIVEDEPDIAELLSFNLSKAGFTTSTAARGDVALSEIIRWKPDLVLLDLMLPGIGGIEICRRMKANPETASIPIIMVTARDEETDIVVGLRMGAEDYIVKPFSMNIVIARINTVFRRHDLVPPGPEELCTVHDITIDPCRHEVLCGKKPIELTISEFRLLHFLALRPSWVFTREQIVEGIKGTDHSVTDRAVDVLMVSLRRKLGKRGDFIETVRGVGYRFRE